MKTFSRLLFSTFCAGAVSAHSATTHPAESEPVSLENIIVSASPFERAQDEIAQPSSVLAGQRLLLNRHGTLGETLAFEPGISSTYFGPGASRPVIRGLGGDRVRVLASGVGTFCGIGNIGCFVRADGKTRSLASHNGILGHQMRTVQEFSFPFPPRALLYAYSDGMTSRWDPATYAGLETRHPALIAATLYRDHNLGREDTTLAVVRNIRTGP